MNLDRRNIEKILFVGTVFILLYLGLQNMNVVANFLNWLMGVLLPFIIAVCCTLFLNVPLKAIEKRLFRPKNGKPVSPVLERMRRPIAITLSIILFILVIGAFLIVIIPEIGKSLNTLAAAIPGAITHFREWVTELGENNEVIQSVMNSFNWDDVTKYVTGFLQNDAAGLVSYAMSMVSSLVSIAINFFLGIVLSVYTLAKKEKISSSVKKLIYALLPTKAADFVVEVGVLTNKSFYNCITGQMMECVILGSLTALGMTIFGFPYAALIGVMVAILSWIPMFGVGIGAAIGALFILTVSPIQAIWFVVFMICLQQIEGNLIFPRVVGNNIGLPPILLISAIVLFSNFFGIIGLLVSGAVSSVLYTLVRRFIFTRLREKKIPHSKYEMRTERGSGPKLYKMYSEKNVKLRFRIPENISSRFKRTKKDK